MIMSFRFYFIMLHLVLKSNLLDEVKAVLFDQRNAVEGMLVVVPAWLAVPKALADLVLEEASGLLWPSFQVVLSTAHRLPLVL